MEAARTCDLKGPIPVILALGAPNLSPASLMRIEPVARHYISIGRQVKAKQANANVSRLLFSVLPLRPLRLCGKEGIGNEDNQMTRSNSEPDLRRKNPVNG
jgi:hypothetical protein